MTLGFYDHNEGIAYPLQEHTAVDINGTEISSVIVGASFSLSTASGFDSTVDPITLDSVERIGFQLLRFYATAGVVSFQFDVNHPAGEDVSRYTVVRSFARESGIDVPEFGTASLVINRLGGLLSLAVSATAAIAVDFEPGTIHVNGDAPVSAVRLVNKARNISLTLWDDPIPTPVPTELLSSPLSVVSNTPQVDVCVGTYDILEVTTIPVEIITYVETIIQVDVPTFIEDAISVPITGDGAADFTVTGSVTGWLADGPYSAEIYTITITDFNTNEFSASSNQGDVPTLGNIVFDSPVAVGTKGLTVQWDTSITPLTNGMTWQVTARRGTFDVPTNQSVFVPTPVIVDVPVLTPSSTALTLEYYDITTSALSPVLTDIVVTDTYEDEDDTARGLSGFDYEIVEVAYFTEAFDLQEGYNIDFGVVASVPRIQFNLLPNGGRGLVPADAAISNCNLALRTFFGAVPSDGEITFEAGAGFIITPEKGAHRVTLTIFEPTTNGVESCD